MKTVVSPSSRRIFPGPFEALRRAWAFNRPLTFTGVAMLLTLLVALAGVILDPRVITGAPAWLKPAKFAISISIYCFTLLWLLTFVQGRPRLVRLVAWSTAIALGLEEVLIAGAVIFGTTSHFNVATPVGQAVWLSMFWFILVTWVANLIAAILLLIQRLPDPAFAWALRLGLLISFVGMGVAFFMTSPTAAQLTAAESGNGMPIAGAHSVGVEDGGPGLPITGWSTTGGDLRVPHFFGLHGLQALPLFGLLLAEFGPGWLRADQRVTLVWAAGLSYLGFVVLLTWQALRGQPLISPDSMSLAALGALAVTAGGISLGSIIHAWSTRDETKDESWR